MASGDRERELQRQLTQAGLQAEALLEGSQAAAAAESEDIVKGLIQQRDTANDVLVVRHCRCVAHMLLCTVAAYWFLSWIFAVVSGKSLWLQDCCDV